ncbi:MAG: CotH kinase family protein, partial [Bacteroidota bacterium]
TVIAANNTWQYLVPTSEPAASWRLPNQNLVGWSTGTGGIGFGDNDDGTTIPTSTSVFLRKTFNLSDVATIEFLKLYMDYDDGFVAYINGVEIARANVGAVGTPPAFNSFAAGNHEANGYQGIALDGYVVNMSALEGILVSGENVLAIQVHNATANSSDITSNAYLAAGVINSTIQFGPALTWMNLVASIAWHTNFEISTGDQIMLSLPNGNPADLVTAPPMDVDYSYNHSGITWCFSNTPTPNALNSATCYSSFVNKPTISVPAGIYASGQTIAMFSQDPNAEIRYTLDGSIPVDTSLLYTGPINIDVTTVVSARCFDPLALQLPSATEKNTYVINEAYIGIPVISISTDDANLYDTNIGIYVLGPPDYNTGYPYFGANFWEDWERFSYIEYIATDSTQKFEGCIGLKIHGGWSRAQPQKSFRVKCRDEYGFSKINYPCIPDKPNVTEYKGFNLRNGGNDYGGSRMRDAFMHRLTKGTHTDYMGYSPVIVFLNGEYFGEYELRETLNKHWVESNWGYNSDEATVITENYLDGLDPNDGDLVDFNVMYNLIAGADPTTADFYALADSLIDLENFADYIITETYYGNGDWSNGYPNNIKFWHVPGQKWRMMLMDLDFGYGLYGATANDNFIVQAINDPSIHMDVICSKLLQNIQFRNYFIDRYADLINTIWQQPRVVATGNSMINEVAPWIPRHHTRWSGDMTTFNNTMTNMFNWNNNRIPGARNVVQSQFALTGQVTYTLDVQPAGAGRIHISTIEPSEVEYPWNGVYFKGVPVRITAVANPGYTFDHWSPNSLFASNNYSQDLNITPTVNAAFTAWFEGSPVENPVYISEVMPEPENSMQSGDWFEIHNTMDVDMDLTGCAVRDTNIFHNFEFPLATSIPAGGYLVVAEDTAAFHAMYPNVQNVIGPLGFSLNNTSETIRILSHQGNAYQELTYETSWPWPLGVNGYGRSLELDNPNLNANLPQAWFAGCVDGSPGEPYFPCDSSIVISEINYKSAVTADAGDWFELHSTLDFDLNLGGWVVSDGGISTGFVIPIGTVLPTHGYLVFAQDDALFTSIHPGVSNVILPTQISLGGAEGVLVFDETGKLRFSVNYLNVSPWTVEPNGGGKTLELVSTTARMNEWENWFAGCPNGSPGTAYDPTCGVNVAELENLSDLEIYPTVADEFIMVRTEQEQLIQMVNGVGELIRTVQLYPGTNKILVDELSSGLYLLGKTKFMKR